MAFAFLFGNSTQAQTAVRMKVGSTTNCLTAVFVADGILVSDSCATVKWTVNNGTTAVATGNKVSYTFSAAGTYTVCAKLLNTCKKFDTSVCMSVTVVSCDCKLTTEFSFKNDCKKAFSLHRQIKKEPLIHGTLAIKQKVKAPTQRTLTCLRVFTRFVLPLHGKIQPQERFVQPLSVRR